MRVIGQFAPLDGRKLPGSLDVHVGQVISQVPDSTMEASLSESYPNLLDRLDRTRREWEVAMHTVAPPVVPEGMVVREWVFNGTNRGWHYPFIGSKRDSNISHAWRTFVLLPCGATGGYVVAAILDSPSFHLFCRRRNRGPLAEERKRLTIAPPQPPMPSHPTPSSLALSQAYLDRPSKRLKPCDNFVSALEGLLYSMQGTSDSDIPLSLKPNEDMELFACRCKEAFRLVPLYRDWENQSVSDPVAQHLLDHKGFISDFTELSTCNIPDAQLADAALSLFRRYIVKSQHSIGSDHDAELHSFDLMFPSFFMS